MVSAWVFCYLLAPGPRPELVGLADPIYIHPQGDGVLSPLLACFLISRAALWTDLCSPPLSFFFCPMEIHSSTSWLLTVPDLIPGIVHSESLGTSSTLPDFERVRWWEPRGVAPLLYVAVQPLILPPSFLPSFQGEHGQRVEWRKWKQQSK